MNKLLSRFLIIFFLLGIFSFIPAKPAHAAANMYLSPGAATISQGSTFSVSIRTNTSGASVNAVQANLSYPADKLTYLGTSTGGSAFEIQAESSGGSGSIKIGRGSVSAKSGDLLIAVVTFSAIPSSGSAAISFSSGSAVVSSSTNADIAGGKSGATFTFQKAPPPPKPKPKDKTAPKISDVKVTEITNNSATISWVTNENSDSLVTWGPTEKFGLSNSSSKLVKKHSVKLTSELLFRGAKYHLKVTSKDKSGNKSSSDTLTFQIPGFKIQIKVVDIDGNPVEGATVEVVDDGTATTDANGIATLDNVPEGELTVIIKYEGQVLAEKINVEDIEGQQSFNAQFAGAFGSDSTIAGVNNNQLSGLVVLILIIVVSAVAFRFKGKIFKKKEKIKKDSSKEEDPKD